MKALRLIYIPAILVLFPLVAFADESILTCKFKEISTFYYNKDKIEAELDREKNADPVIFAGLDTETPVMKGNMGETSLSVLMRDSETIWLVEAPPLGGANVWTIFKKQKIAIQAKQYSMFGKPFGLMSMGKCD